MIYSKHSKKRLEVWSRVVMSSIYLCFLSQELIDPHAAVRNHTEKSCAHFPHFPPVVTSCKLGYTLTIQTAPGGFSLHFPNGNDIEQLFMFLFAICVSSSMQCLSFAHFLFFSF